MKYYLIVCIVFILLIISVSYQERKPLDVSNIIYDTISVSENKTTYLIFNDCKVIWINIGNTKDFVVDIKGNTILLKALRISNPTNFIIELDNKRFLSGMVRYESDLSNPVYEYNFTPIERVDTSSVCNYGFLYKEEEYNSIGLYQDKILIQVVNIYHDDHSFYFRLKMTNGSKIDYTIENIKIYVKDSKNGSLKKEIRTNFEKKKVLGGNNEYLYLCSELESISEKESVYIEVIENGFRNYQLIIPPKIIQTSTKIEVEK